MFKPREVLSLALLFFLSSGSIDSTAAERPGNVFVVGDEMTVRVPDSWTTWRAIDIEGKEVGAGNVVDGNVQLPELPVGYYEVREKGGTAMVTAAVLAKVKPVEDTPIAVDAAMSWFYSDEAQIRGACALCRLAGVNWVRDRSMWGELETARGTWAEETRYERSMKIQHEEGLKILQVNHVSAPWATPTPVHFPDDLRDVHSFYRGLAKRWKDLADAIEPWNEPDLDIFGGHTGCEIASFQKAAYLGLKAGDPQKPVCDVAFFTDRPETLDEFRANEVYPYFDRYDLHHYFGLPRYPAAYARHRLASAGRPMWTTEFNLTINWSDATTHEPSEEDLRRQAYRVSKVFAGALHEGVEKAFYFILGHYVERQLQYGVVRADLTPRPAYVALAAVGRLFNGAKPIGRVDLGDKLLKAYVFRTTVDGVERETLVAWSETTPTRVETAPAEKLFDYLGREIDLRKRVTLSPAPVFMVLPPGGSKKLKVEPAPVAPKWQKGEACPVVLQLIGEGDWKESVFELGESKELRLVAYNFGDKTARGTLRVEGAASQPGAKDAIEIQPGERAERTLIADGSGQVTAHADMGELGTAVVSARTSLQGKTASGE